MDSHTRDLELKNGITIEEVITRVKERCDGNPYEWGLTIYKGECYSICSTDCADCGVRGLLKLLIDVKHDSEI